MTRLILSFELTLDEPRNFTQSPISEIVEIVTYSLASNIDAISYIGYQRVRQMDKNQEPTEQTGEKWKVRIEVVLEGVQLDEETKAKVKESLDIWIAEGLLEILGQQTRIQISN